MQLETIELSQLNPAAYNPRKDLQPDDPEYQKLKKSIMEFELVEPIIWNKRSGNIVGGHQRRKILEELGHTETTVVTVDFFFFYKKPKITNQCFKQRIIEKCIL